MQLIGLAKEIMGAFKGFEMCLKIWKFLRGRGRYIPELRVISPGSGGYDEL
jgi:hypothetical protein